MTTDPSEYYSVYDLKFVTGDYKKWRIFTQDPDPNSPDPQNPVMIPRNFTGWSGRAQIRINTKRESPIEASLVVTLGEVDPTDGWIIIEIMDLESAKCIKPGGWDLELTDPSGHPETVMGGKALPMLDYTR